jgi:hypothetical protein
MTVQRDAWHSRLLIGALLFTLTACGSPTSPSEPTVQGFWHGGWMADNCTGSGIYSANCNYLDAGGFNLRLTQS